MSSAGFERKQEMSPAASGGAKEDAECAGCSRESTDREMTGSATLCRRSPAVGRGLPRLILQWIVLLSHMYSTEALSELRHQLTDTSVNTTSEGSGSQWTEYGSWTACSSSCGYGIQYQNRTCSNLRNGFIDARFCVGSDRRYRICKTDVAQPCQSYMGFRAQMCSEYTEFGVQWKPYLSPSVGPCQVSCYATDETRPVFRILDQWLPNGTPCASYSGCDWWNRAGRSQGICLQGQCSDVGCDGIVNSTKVLDACGVCGGDRAGCRVVSGKFSEIQQDVYTEVVEIPAGAFNIRVYEMEKTRNHLAIKDETGTPVLNSIFEISSPGRYEVAGTTAIYKRCGISRYSPGHYEEISIPGTTSAKIIILMVYTRKYSQANIAYRYSLSLPSPKTLSTSATLTTATTSEIPDVITDLGTTLRHDGEDSTGSPRVGTGNQDMHNVVAVKTLSYRDDEVQGTDEVQGSDEQLPSFPQEDSTVANSGRSATPTAQQNTSAEFKEPTIVGKTESYLEIQNVSQEFQQTVDRTVSGESHVNFLPWSQNSSLHQGKPSVLDNPVGVFSETQERVLWELDGDPEREEDILPVLETSGYLDDNQGETTLEPTSGYPSSNSRLPENSSQVISDTAESHFPLESEEQASSTVASTSPSSSPTSGQMRSFENDLFGDDDLLYITQQDSRTSEPPSVATSIPPTQTGRTVTAEEPEDSQDFPWKYVPGIPDSSELLFGEVPQIMELINPSMESQEPALQPSAAASTAAIVSRGDIPEEERTVKQRYLWARTGVAPCSATCTRGMSRTYAYCTLNGEQVPDNLCDPASKPEVVERECGGKTCETRWAVGSWSQCTVSCGTGAVYRTVHCWLMIAPGLDTSISNSYCSQSNVPESVRPCTLSPCGPQWQTSDWSECSVQCGEGAQTREVRCSVEGATCNPSIKPAATKRCLLQACPSQWTTSQWTQCQGPCTVQNRRVDCVNPRGIIVTDKNCAADSKPLSHRLCGEACPAQWVAQGYGPCLGECGSTTRQRRVVCAATSAVSGHMQVLVDSVCSASPKPSSEMSCELVSCQQQRRVTRRRRQTPQWLTTPWSVCSVTCGTGQRTREITCNRRRNQPRMECNESKKPIGTESCAMGECPAVNPTCSDSPAADCNLIRRANLCRYDSYKRSCCLSCSS
ncbi:ADAMTS-like protein 2 [Patiria miniata]|uniref:PLAC domain-containing protein n=1 Tax=Patiria miniata TaxID=46514 RepID=A0A913Z238_PATMI|nr:ADAMTS-like protein 2 [Patiria miniata]